jgi:hypothetical protein
MTPMKIEDALPLYFQSIDSAMSLWNFLFTVAVGLVGFSATIDATKLRASFFPVLGAFVLVAIVNFYVMFQAYGRRVFLFEHFIKAQAKGDQPLIDAFTPTPSWLIYGSHILVDVLTVLTLIMLYRVRKPVKSREPATRC